jgi:hypothetical protein
MFCYCCYDDYINIVNIIIKGFVIAVMMMMMMSEPMTKPRKQDANLFPCQQSQDTGM